MFKFLTSLFSKSSPSTHKDTDSQTPRIHFFKRITRVFVDATRGFIEDDCYAKASALTFYSLLSIVPVLAVLFGIAKGFGFERALEFEIRSKFFEQPEITEKLIQFAYSWLNNVQGGVIVGIGTALLLWSVIGLLNNIEGTLNAIWKTRTGRPYFRKIVDYSAVIVIAPIFLVISSSINVFLTASITRTAQNSVLIEAVSPLLLFIIKFFPYFLLWGLFAFIYIFMPNTKVHFKSAVIAAILGGTVFQIWQWIYIKFQFGAASYGAIYGSFAALPLFLIWLQFSWMILLAGAEVAVEMDNDLFIPNRLQLPLAEKAAALLIVYRCIEKFANGLSPLTDRALAQELGVSLNQVHNLVRALQQANIVSVVIHNDKLFGYQPARSMETIKMKDVCTAIEKNHEILASTKRTPELHKILDYLKDIDHVLENSPHNPNLYP